MSLLPECRRAEVLRGIAGKIPCIHFCSKETYFNALDDVISGLRRDGIDDIVILSLSTETDSIVSGAVKNGVYGEIRFMSCRKFKGLEADAVILVDFTERTVTECIGANVRNWCVAQTHAGSGLHAEMHSIGAPLRKVSGYVKTGK